MHKAQVVNNLPSHYIEHEYFNEMVSHLTDDVFDKKRIIISNDYKNIQFTGSGVIAILTAGDEKGNPPNYSDNVRLVFKHHLDKDNIKNIYHIPLTYVSGFNGDYSIPINNRKYDVCFIGRNQKRTDFISEVNRLMKKRPSLKYCVKITGYKFMQGWSIEKYASMMMNSKIILSPRGAIRPECLRFTEAVKCGSAIIACKHPSLRVFDNCPANYIDDWNKLIESVDDLLSDTNKLAEIHNNMKKSWDNYFSPKAVAGFITKITKESYETRKI